MISCAEPKPLSASIAVELIYIIRPPRVHHPPPINSTVSSLLSVLFLNACNVEPAPTPGVRVLRCSLDNILREVLETL